MQSSIRVLLVHRSEDPWGKFTWALKALGLTPCQARNCDEAGQLITELGPEVVFSESELPDGNWQSVLHMAEQAEQPVKVIVVGKHDDTELYQSAMQQGAHDFIAPPAAAHDLTHILILRSAIDDALRRSVKSVD